MLLLYASPRLKCVITVPPFTANEFDDSMDTIVAQAFRCRFDGAIENFVKKTDIDVVERALYFLYKKQLSYWVATGALNIN